MTFELDSSCIQIDQAWLHLSLGRREGERRERYVRDVNSDAVLDSVRTTKCYELRQSALGDCHICCLDSPNRYAALWLTVSKARHDYNGSHILDPGVVMT